MFTYDRQKRVVKENIYDIGEEQKQLYCFIEYEYPKDSIIERRIWVNGELIFEKQTIISVCKKSNYGLNSFS